jgi:hypothetical protein
MTRSLSILLPAPMGHEWNAVLEHHGRGPRNLSVLCYSGGSLMIGCHAWEADATRYTHPGRPSFMTQQRYNATRAAIVVSDQPLGEGAGAPAFDALATAQGVQWGGRLPMLPEAGSGVTVAAGAFYQTEGARFPVVRVVQGHQRHDPSHTDIAALFALFEPIRDPFRPAPWVQPLGTVGLYHQANIIGGPELAIHVGQIWRSTIANNSWAPGVFGWVDEGPA